MRVNPRPDGGQFTAKRRVESGRSGKEGKGAGAGVLASCHARGIPPSGRKLGVAWAGPGQGLGSPVPAPNHHQAVGRLLDTRHRNLVESQHPREAPRPRFSITRSSCALPGSLVLVWALGGGTVLGLVNLKVSGGCLHSQSMSGVSLIPPRVALRLLEEMCKRRPDYGRATGEHGRLTACFGARTGARHSSQAPLESTR